VTIASSSASRRATSTSSRPSRPRGSSATLMSSTPGSPAPSGPSPRWDGRTTTCPWSPPSRSTRSPTPNIKSVWVKRVGTFRDFIGSEDDASGELIEKLLHLRDTASTAEGGQPLAYQLFRERDLREQGTGAQPLAKSDDIAEADDLVCTVGLKAAAPSRRPSSGSSTSPPCSSRTASKTPRASSPPSTRPASSPPPARSSPSGSAAWRCSTATSWARATNPTGPAAGPDPLPRRLHPRDDPGRRGTQDVQEPGQRRRPARHHPQPRRRRDALHARRDDHADAGRPHAGRE
jgi:hypothetical protein